MSSGYCDTPARALAIVRASIALSLLFLLILASTQRVSAATPADPILDRDAGCHELQAARATDRELEHCEDMPGVGLLNRAELSLTGSPIPPHSIRPTPRLAGTIDGALPHLGGVGFVVWNGGPVQQLVAAAGAQGCATRSVWVMLDGRYVGYTASSPAFANAAWNARYASGIPGPTPMLVVCAEVSVAMLPDTPATLDKVVIGRSVEGRPIEVYCVGDGTYLALLVGGMHTGVEKNTVTLARQVMTEMQRGDLSIPLAVRLCVLPALNPDGLARDERTNAHGVDLNRNWPSEDWQPEAFHPASGPVSAGTRPLSEPETQALADFVRDASPAIVVVWHSYAALVESNGVPLARRLGQAYAEAAGLDYIAEWDPYPICGQFIDAMEELGVPAIDVELRWTDDGEFEAHREGINALLADLAIHQ